MGAGRNHNEIRRSSSPEPSETPPHGGSLRRAYVALLLIVHVALLTHGAWLHSPSSGEMASLGAALHTWENGSHEYFLVNPPLVRSVAVLPILAAGFDRNGTAQPTGCEPSVPAVPHNGPDRSEFDLGLDFFRTNNDRALGLFFLARCACIPFSLLGAVVCYSWAKDLFGSWSGLLAITLWCLSPSILAYGQMVTADTAAASFGIMAAYCFARWMRQRRFTAAYVAGCTLGLAALTKLTWIILFPLWAVMGLLVVFTSRQNWRVKMELGMQVLALLALALLVVNSGYSFEGSFKPLGEYSFSSAELRARTDAEPQRLGLDNRFQDSFLATVPVPLPVGYVRGIDIQKADFERINWSYLQGHWRTKGWWHYYLYALAAKLPLGTWGLVILAMAHVVLKQSAASWRDELVLLAPPVAVLLLVSSQTGMNAHFRYLLPVLPFLFVSVSRAAVLLRIGPSFLALAVIVATSLSVTSSLWAYPHSLSYFNELAGGARRGPVHLLGTHIDWGQDLLHLKRWLTRHDEVVQLRFSVVSSVAPDLLDLPRRLPPKTPLPSLLRERDRTIAKGPLPGWYALSVNRIWDRSGEYRYLLRFDPVATAGYSIYIYHITLEDANRVRRELGLPKLPGDWDKTTNVTHNTERGMERQYLDIETRGRMKGSGVSFVDGTGGR